MYIIKNNPWQKIFQYSKNKIIILRMENNYMETFRFITIFQVRKEKTLGSI